MDGSMYNNHYIWVFDFEDGKVRLVKELHETLHVYRVVPADVFRGPAQERTNTLYDDPSYVIDAASGEESALAIPLG